MKAVDRRVLEAEKKVVANMLYRWKRDYDMDYLIVVKNSKRSFYSHSHLSSENIPRMEKLAKHALQGRK